MVAIICSHKTAIADEGDYLSLPMPEKFIPALQTDGSPQYISGKDNCLDSFTRQYVHKLLKKSGGNVSQAARLSDLTRVALQKIMRRYNIDGNQFR